MRWPFRRRPKAKQWWRLVGVSPGSLFQPKVSSEWRESKDDPYFQDFARRARLPIQDPPHRVPPGEEWAARKHLMFVCTFAQEQPYSGEVMNIGRPSYTNRHG